MLLLLLLMMMMMMMMTTTTTTMTHKMCNIEIVVGSSVFAVPSLTSAQCRLESVAYTHSIREASCFNSRHFVV
jgi:hypothetical protein